MRSVRSGKRLLAIGFILMHSTGLHDLYLKCLCFIGNNFLNKLQQNSFGVGMM